MKKLLFLLLLVNTALWGQTIKDTSIYAPVFSVSYAGQLPVGILAERFGINSNLGFSGGIKTASNWQYEFQGTFFFSKNIKNTLLLDPLATSSGTVINQNGEPARIEMYERGFTGTFNVGKVFPIIGPNPNSGIIAKFGVGLMRHKIRIDSESNAVPLLNDENAVYWDRLTLGIMTQQYIGYQHLGNSNLANFTFGLEFMQGFTQGMRDYQIDLEGPYRDKRIDMLLGVRIGWVIPIYRRAPNVTG
ncbi:MAG: hypothetical protein ACI9N1_002498 [Flavobacteriales bacterium]|jgi:hypothetical protein